MKYKKLLFYTSLSSATIVFFVFFVYQIFSFEIKTAFFHQKSTNIIQPNKQITYYQAIGKTSKQMLYDKYSTIGVNILQIAPVAMAIAIKNPVLYTTYAGAIAIVTPVVVLAKKFIKEARPDDANDFTSFPSGHTAFAFLCATILCLFTKHIRCKHWIRCLYVISAIIIAILRILAKRHWFVDVCCGGIFGCVSAIIAYYFVVKINEKLQIFK